MSKLLLIMLMLTVWASAHALQIDEERSIRTLFESKHSVSRAVHAAAQQLNKEDLAEGRFTINEEAAYEKAMEYLRLNLLLDASGHPLPGSRLRQRVVLEDWAVINAGQPFPFTYRNSRYNYEVTLDRPGVVMIIAVSYPRFFSMMEPVVWHVKGTAELTGPMNTVYTSLSS
ncbi:hypothetical protein [Paenibacillus humicus]|uniref:hypothetical protein n=1 Tax=Paenibacillus humicus TaxID=412861 RepID=UPI003F13ADAE